MIQDGAVNGELAGFDFEYEAAEIDDGLLESITVRPIRPDGVMVSGMSNHWVLSIPRSKRAEPRQ